MSVISAPHSTKWFEATHVCTPQHPAGIYHVYHLGTLIGRQYSMPSHDDCLRMLASIPAAVDVPVDLRQRPFSVSGKGVTRTYAQEAKARANGQRTSARRRTGDAKQRRRA